MKIGALKRCLLSGLVCLTVLALTACGGDEKEPEEPLPPRAATFLSLMEHMPQAEDGDLELFYIDYAFVRETLGVPLPPAGASSSEIRAYLNAIVLEVRVSAGLSGFTSGFDPDAWMAEVGYGVTSVDQLANVLFAPHYLSILRGRFDAGQVRDAVHTDSIFSEYLTEHERHGVLYYSWLDDFERAATASAFRPHRIGGRMSVDAEYLLWAHWTDGMEAMIDAAEGKRQTLAELPAARAIARAIDDLGAYTLNISSASVSIGDDLIRDLVTGEYGQDNVARVEQEGLLEPYKAIGVGMGFDGDEEVAILVYLYDTESQAKENGRGLLRILANGTSLARRVPWNQLMTDFSVEVHGASIHVTIHTEGTSIAIDAWQNLDTLVLTRAVPLFR